MKLPPNDEKRCGTSKMQLYEPGRNLIELPQKIFIRNFLFQIFVSGGGKNLGKNQLQS